ncbi:MAG: DUF5658 family protein [Phycisphaeraceae bacterium]
MSESPRQFDDAVAADRRGKAGVYYPDAYLWLVLVSTLDIFLTTAILALGGAEVNPLANFILVKAGLPGIVFFKYGAVALVICICEYIARQRPNVGRHLSRFAVAISAVPVVAGMVQLVLAFYA